MFFAIVGLLLGLSLFKRTYSVRHTGVLRSSLSTLNNSKVIRIIRLVIAIKLEDSICIIDKRYIL